ncbi:MAG: heme-binding protein [Burkholderiales bacterium]|nr:heme-binding protein [Burkholderiales bacterium]
MPDKSPLPFSKVQAAMNAMTDKALQTPDDVVAIAIADSTGNLLAYAQTGALRLFSRRHAIRKAYTAAVMATDTGANGKKLKAQGRSISEMGDANLTANQGGLVIERDGVILGGIGVGGYDGGHLDEALARIGLEVLLR